MKCIVITKKHIYTIFIGVISILALVAAISACIMNNTAIETFTQEDIKYSNMLSEQLPTTDKTDIFDKIKGALKKNIDKPENMIKETSPIFEDKYEEQEYEEIIPTPAPTAEPQQPTPTKEPIKTEEVTISEGMKVRNETKFNVDLNELSKENLPFNIDKNGPQVLIIHTHTTESYSDSIRTTDETKNMIAIGDIVKQELEKKGINVLHDKTVHDYPSYKGAYTRTLSTIKSDLDKNSSIKVVLDIHRDALIKNDGTQMKVVTDIDGIKTAQVMLVVGTNGTGLSHEYWKDNLIFASKIQRTANEKYKGFIRPLNLREERFNQHLTKGSLIVEIGSTGNTFDEACEGAKRIGEIISNVLTA